MTVTYLLRSPGTGHSIEELFDNIHREIGRRTITANKIQLPYISQSIRSVWQNLRIVKNVFADIFHITGDIHYVALALPALHTILTIHDCSLLENNRKRPVRYVIFWLFWYYLPIKRAACVTTISEKTRQDLLRYVGRAAQKVQVIPNAYNPSFTYQPRPFCRKRPILLQVGTAPNKNLTRLLAAIEGIACTLVIIGPLSEAAISDLHTRRIDYRNHVNISWAEVAQCYINCDIVTFVSTYEGFGMPILEANAVGRAIITSDAPPMRDVANSAAHLIDPTDVAAIRQGILQLIQDHTYRKRLIEKGFQNSQRYTLGVVANKYETLYRQMLETKVSSENGISRLRSFILSRFS